METTKIMIVEDEAIIALELKSFLEQKGFTITSTSASGEQAILNTGKENPDLVLMDIALKGEIDGIQAASIIRESADIPIIFLTAFADQEKLDKAKLTMPFGYILKPYQERDLIVTIDMALYSARMDRERKKIEEALKKANDELELNVEQRTKELIDTNKELRNEIESRKQSEKALKEAYTIINRNPIVAFRWKNIQGWPVEFVTDNVQKLFGYKAEDFTSGQVPYINTIHPDDIKRVAQEVSTFSSEKERTQFSHQPYRIITKNGKVLWIEDRTFIKRDNKNNISHYEGVIKDITEQRILEKQVKQNQKMEAVGLLAGGIAHDFNNILVPILGYTEMLLEDSPEGSSWDNNLNEIYNGALRAKDLVQQILTFSRKESHELKPMRIQPIVYEALKLIRSTIPTTIDIKQNIHTNCGPVNANSTQIHQIIMNLTTNAYHAMQDIGSELKVSLEEIELDKSKLINSELEPGLYACLTISDQGMGMSKDLIEKIFDPFFTTKKTGKGTGMGLSVVHGIVKNMNGYIQVYSEPGKGSKFHVYLPLIKENEQQTQTKNPIEYGTETLLLVDDEEMVITMEKQMLERFGYKVTALLSSIDALEIFCTNPDKFDLVITDMAMPNLPGDKLAVKLLKIRPDIPILLCTGFSDHISEERAVSIGIKGILMKPIAMKHLSQTIREVLDGTKINS